MTSRTAFGISFPPSFFSPTLVFQVFATADNPSFHNSSCIDEPSNPPQQAKIRATELHVEQVIEDPRLPDSAAGSVDLVQDKSASFKVTLTGENLQNASGDIEVKIMRGGITALGGTEMASTVIPVSDITNANGSLVIKPDQFKSYKVPMFSGPITVELRPTSPTVSVVPEFPQLKATVHTITPPTVGVVRVGECIGSIYCYPAATLIGYDNVIAEQEFASNVFPVADQKLEFSPIQQEYKSFWSDLEEWNRINNDALDLMNLKHLLGKNRLIAVVPKGYFVFNFFKDIAKVAGMAGLQKGDILFVMEGRPGTATHELGHSFGLLHIEAYVKGWNANHFPPEDKDGSPNIMSRSIENTLNDWLDSWSYDQLFKTLLNPPKDPPTILISGVLGQDGRMSFGPSYEIPNGVITEPDPDGTIKIEVLNAASTVLTSTTMAFNSLVNVDYVTGADGPSSIDTGAMPFAIELSQESGAQFVRVSKDGVVLKKVSLNGRLLTGIIQAIPLEAFRSSSEEKMISSHSKAQNHKQILLKHAAQINQMLDLGKTEGAEKEMHAIIEQIESWVKRSYVPTDKSQYSQQDAIAKIGAIILKLEKIEKIESKQDRHAHESQGNSK